MKDLRIEITINGSSLYRTFKIETFEDVERADWNTQIISMVETIKESYNHPF